MSEVFFKRDATTHIVRTTDGQLYLVDSAYYQNSLETIVNAMDQTGVFICPSVIYRETHALYERMYDRHNYIIKNLEEFIKNGKSNSN